MGKITKEQFDAAIDPKKDHIPMTEEERKIVDDYLEQEHGDIIHLLKTTLPYMLDDEITKILGHNISDENPLID